MSDIKKISVSSLKMILTTLPHTKGQIKTLTDWLTGYDWPVKEDKIILVPEAVNIPRDLPARRQGYYSVLDIIEMAGGESPSDNVRYILFEGNPELIGGVSPPMRLVIETAGDGPDTIKLNIIPGDHDLHMDLLEGVTARIGELGESMIASLDAARDYAARQLELQRML